MERENERAFEAQLRANVERHGWSVLRVGVPAGEEGPEFAYSVGMWATFRHPELIIVGLPLESAHAIINDVGEAIRGGRVFHAGDVADDEFLEGYAVTFRDVPTRQYEFYLGWANWFYRGDDFPCLQLIYPDRERRWPWAEGVASGFREWQPVLAEAPPPTWASSDSD